LQWRKLYFPSPININSTCSPNISKAALEKVVYKTIDDEEPIFFSVQELQGAWATGKTELVSVIEGWIST
jgi:hypothetical protein